MTPTSTTPMQGLADWLREREANAQRIAKGTRGIEADGWFEDADYFKRAAEAVEAASQAQGLPPGFVAVPVEATTQMLEAAAKAYQLAAAGLGSFWAPRAAYRELIAARPAVPAVQPVLPLSQEKKQ